MSALAKAFMALGSVSILSTLTQVIKAKAGAIFLGVEGFGILNQLTFLWTLFFNVSGLGIYNGIVKNIAEDLAKKDENEVKSQFISSALFLLGWSTVIFVLALVLSPQISHFLFSDNGERYYLVSIILASVPLGIIAQVYKGLFSAYRNVKAIVRIQIISDVLSVFVFVASAWIMGLDGAVIAFVLYQASRYSLYWLYAGRFYKKSYKLTLLVDKASFFHLKKNVGFGISGLFLSVLAVVTTLLVSKVIVSYGGLYDNGIFFVGWKVSNLYFGALYASVSGYLFPLLVSCLGQLSFLDNLRNAVGLYNLMLTPIAISLILGGAEVMEILFTEDFTAAAFLLLFFLPADFFRINAETIGLNFLARQKLFVYTLVYCVWALGFVLGSYFLYPVFGLAGVGAAYLSSNIINFLLVLIVTKKQIDFSYGGQNLRIMALSALLICFSVFYALVIDGLVLRLVVTVLLLILWILLSWREDYFSQVISKFKIKRAK